MTFPDSERAKEIPAILTAMRPGEEGGEAVVAILTGDVAPSGRLTNTWVRDVGYIGTAVQPYWCASKRSVCLEMGPRVLKRKAVFVSRQFKQIATKDWMDGP